MNSFAYPLTESPTRLCGSRGRLNPQAVGWSPQPHLDCTINGHLGRRKRWNHWCITTPGWMLSLTQADLDYIRYGAAYFLDLETGQAVAHRQLSLLGRGCLLPDQPLHSHQFNHPRLQLRCAEHPGRARLTLDVPNIGGQPLQVTLDVQRPAHLDSVNLVAPLGPRGFHATCRQLGLPINGSVQLGKRRYHCPPGQSFAAMDFGRGVWPLRSHWTRAAFAAPGGIAGNFGSGWTDYSGLSENALWFGGELLHLDRAVSIEQQPPGNASAQWHLSTGDGQVELSFSARHLHHACPRLGPFYADTQQWFGHFNGVLRGPSGERVPVDSALGWLGATRARW
ncbi:DUF2804 domain-containing protein [Pseudomonas zhanjiangensis]|uniref:DUF2804 domain-containing protein n=1 Tax=Pseudomonas zhanjiangensis TaxID=3239015 RepID=A0ABV3YSV6_9PSED